jgi:hypothetical protein
LPLQLCVGNIDLSLGNDRKNDGETENEIPIPEGPTEAELEAIRREEIRHQQELAATTLQRYYRGRCARKIFSDMKTKALFDSIQKQALDNGPKLSHVRDTFHVFRLGNDYYTLALSISFYLLRPLVSLPSRKFRN